MELTQWWHGMFIETAAPQPWMQRETSTERIQLIWWMRLGVSNLRTHRFGRGCYCDYLLCEAARAYDTP